MSTNFYLRGYSRSRRKWQAQVGAYGRHSHLGFFDDEESAARAYDAALLESFGAFARLNFPKEISA